jgi:3-hydroxyisobutyrate dehydrogenase
VRIGFIGLGTMGQGMARNLARAGVQLTVFDTNADAVNRLVADGAVAAAGVAELAGSSDVIFTSLPGPVELEAVALGAGGIRENLRPDVVLFDLSTSSLSLARRIHDEFRHEGAWMLDAPISGGPAGAASGSLTLWVGGERPIFERHLDLLRIIGDQPRHVGQIGAGTVTKLAHNLVGYMIMQSLSEVFSMAVKAGMDPLDLWEAMRLGLVGRSSPLDLLNKQFLPGTYEPAAFALRLAHKDVTLATALARELGVPMRLANLTMEEMTEAMGREMGAQDSRAFLKLQLERAGVEIAVDRDRLERAIEEVSNPSARADSAPA